jgi:hypothetical protein
VKPTIKWQYVEPKLTKPPKHDNPYDDSFLDIENEELDESDRPNQVIFSPFGFLTVPQDCIIGMWVGHCNFGLTEDIAKVIEEVDGVDIFNVFSRYRFGIVAGQCFDIEDVKFRVETAICIETLDNDLENNVQRLKQKLCVHKYWAIYVLPNGHVESIFSDDLNTEYKGKLKLLEMTHMGVGGVFFTNENA